MSLEDKIHEAEEELSKTPVNKGTEGHIARLKARIARMKKAATKKGGGGLSYAVKKSGDATVLIVGFPSVGKSSLLNRLTNAKSKVGSFDFTTLDVVPGVLLYKGARIQLFDIPGLIEGAAEGKGRGREILSVVRSADLVLIIVDAQRPKQLDIIKNEMFKAGIRLNQEPPKIDVKKEKVGRLIIRSLVKGNIDVSVVKEICQEFGFHSGEMVLREKVDVDKVVDVLAGNRVYLPAVVVINKIDLVKEKPSIEGIPISAKRGTNIEKVKKTIYKKLNFIRIFLKKIGKEPDLKEPMIITSNARIRDVATKIHGELGERIEYARIWGPSAKFDGQKVGNDHLLKDKDIVELHLEK